MIAVRVCPSAVLAAAWTPSGVPSCASRPPATARCKFPQLYRPPHNSLEVSGAERRAPYRVIGGCTVGGAELVAPGADFGRSGTRHPHNGCSAGGHGDVDSEPAICPPPGDLGPTVWGQV